MKLNIAKTFVISLAFFTISLAWTIYNTFVPIFLIGSEEISGLIKKLNSIGRNYDAGQFLWVNISTVFGNLSDKTRTRFGRRMPFILAGIPLALFSFR